MHASSVPRALTDREQFQIALHCYSRFTQCAHMEPMTPRERAGTLSERRDTRSPHARHDQGAHLAAFINQAYIPVLSTSRISREAPQNCDF